MEPPEAGSYADGTLPNVELTPMDAHGSPASREHMHNDPSKTLQGPCSRLISKHTPYSIRYLIAMASNLIATASKVHVIGSLLALGTARASTWACIREACVSEPFAPEPAFMLGPATKATWVFSFC